MTMKLIRVSLCALALAGAASRAQAVPDSNARVVNIRDHGAVGDGKTVDTTAIQKAIDACAAAGGGSVLVPSGTYRSGSVFLRSKITLQLDKGATLLGSTSVADYPMTKVRWEGQMREGHSALIHAANATQIAIAGQGKIEGGDPLTPNRNPRGPVLVEFLHCHDIRVEGVRLKNNGIWTLHPTFCTDIVVSGVSFETQGANSDGIDPDSCQRMRIEDCTFSTQDDCIAIKSGKGAEGRRMALPSEDIAIRNCVFRGGHSIALGSECSGGIRNVRIEHCRLEEGMKCGVRLKTNVGRGGFIEDIAIRDMDCKLSPAITFFELLMKVGYNRDPEPLPGLEGITRMGDIRIEDIRMQGGMVARVQGDADKPVKGLAINSISGRARRGLAISNANGVQLENLACEVEEGARVSITNVTGTGLEGP